LDREWIVDHSYIKIEGFKKKLVVKEFYLMKVMSPKIPRLKTEMDKSIVEDG
jgi:hypothetical protein